MTAINFEQVFPPDHSPDILDISDALQEQILSIFPEAVISSDRQNVAYGTGRGYKDIVFVISPYSKHVNLGIANGASIEDPSGLMQGSGKVHRHVKLYSLDQVHNPDLHELMQRVLEFFRGQNN